MHTHAQREREARTQAPLEKTNLPFLHCSCGTALILPTSPHVYVYEGGKVPYGVEVESHLTVQLCPYTNAPLQTHKHTRTHTHTHTQSEIERKAREQTQIEKTKFVLTLLAL